MSINTYQDIPDRIREKFHIVFSENLDDKTILFRNDQNKYGVLQFKNTFGLFNGYHCLIPPEYNLLYFNRSFELFRGIQYSNGKYDFQKNRHYLFDKSGKILLELPPGEELDIDLFDNIILRRSRLFGLLNKDLSELVTPRYESLRAINANFLAAQMGGKMGFIRQDGSPVLDITFDEVICRIYDHQVLLRKDNIYYSFVFETSTLKQLPFSKILPDHKKETPLSMTSRAFFRSVMNFRRYDLIMTHDYPYGYGDLLLNYRGHWGIIDGIGNIVLPNDYSFVDFFENPNFFKVGLGEIELEEHEDREGYHTSSLKNVKWGVVDKNNKIVVPIIYDWIQELAPSIWAVYNDCTVYYDISGDAEGWQHIDGKVGIYNHDKLIVPVEYAEHACFYYRINNYVYVRTNTSPMHDGTSMDYDAYTLDGIKIEENKPKRWLELADNRNSF
ncbi:MAG: WG repeat-containing protein [Flavobacteriales bacterium]|jgi:hypothetical protein